MNRYFWSFCALLAIGFTSNSAAQQRPYIGYAYPAGGQQGTTFQVRLGGQSIDDVQSVTISGKGVQGKLVQALRRLNNQEVQLLREQLRNLRREGAKSAPAMMMMSDSEMMSASAPGTSGTAAPAGSLIARLEKRVNEYVQTPACASIASIAVVEITVDPDAEPGDRELRLVTFRGVSNPLVFQIGQLPEVSRKPMLTASQQVLGKEASALRKRPNDEVEARITIPCTANGQIASGEVNKYRFDARKGQKLVISTQARHLVPFIADAVPGWFQPVIALYDSAGKEVAFADDYQFRPDPVILFEVPEEGEYVLAIYDSLFRGREDFVYRMSVGETPFITSIYPLGAKTTSKISLQAQGWNLDSAELISPGPDAQPGLNKVYARNGKLVSNRVPFVLDSLPEVLEREGNNTMAKAQKVELPANINGRIDHKGDLDWYQFQGKAGETIVAAVSARQLDSALDSMIKVMDSTGKLLASNDDAEDPAAGINTHPADSYVSLPLPANGKYYLQIGDTTRQGGDEYGYRIRLAPPNPDFALRAVPSSVALRSKTSTQIAVHLVRKDNFDGPIKVFLTNAPEGFISSPVTLSGTQTVARLNLRTTLKSLDQPVSLQIVGTAKIHGKTVLREACAAEDRTQAFFWRHMVPANDFPAIVYDPNNQPNPRRIPPPVPQTNALIAVANQTAPKQTFSKQQIAGRLRQLKLLFEEGLLTDDFYLLKVAECHAAQ